MDSRRRAQLRARLLAGADLPAEDGLELLAALDAYDDAIRRRIRALLDDEPTAEQMADAERRLREHDAPQGLEG